VRTEADKQNIRDGNEDLLELPTSFSKRRLFGAWLSKIGYIYVLKNVNVYTTFFYFWKKN